MANSRNKNICGIIIAGIVCAILIFLIFKFEIFKYFLNIRHLKYFILSYGKFSAFVFIFIYSIKPIFIFFPASLLSIAAGNIFGPITAFFLSMLGCFFAANFAFFLSRTFGKPFVDKMLRGKVMEMDDSIEKHGLIIILLMRLAFIFPYDPVSYAAGLSKMKYKDFILGTMIGMIPEMIAYSYLGKNMEKPFSKSFFIPILLLIVIALIAYYLYNKFSVLKNK